MKERVIHVPKCILWSLPADCTQITPSRKELLLLKVTPFTLPLTMSWYRITSGSSLQTTRKLSLSWLGPRQN